jgi:hypothetical protein
VQIQLDTIKNNFRPHAGCRVAENSVIAPFPSWLVFPSDSLGFNTFVAPLAPYSGLQLLFSYWTNARYFNPYNYVLDTAWDTTLSSLVLPVRYASSSTALYNLLMRISGRLSDSQIRPYALNTNAQQLPGYYLPFVKLKYVEGKYEVVKTSSVIPAIAQGDILLSADGLTTTQWEDSLRPYFSAGNEAAFHRLMCRYMLGRQHFGDIVSLSMQDSTGTTYPVSTECYGPNSTPSFFFGDFYPADSLRTIRWTTMPCDIGYVNLRNIQPSAVDSMYTELSSKPAIILDLRNYTDPASLEIANRLFPSRREFAKRMIPDVSYPGTYTWVHDSAGIDGNPAPYTGTIILLVDEVTVSQAEYYCMLLEAMPNVIKVGSQTSGANGTVTYWRASTDYTFGFTSHAVFYPDGDSTERIGIVPDTVVHPTIVAVRRLIDEVLNKALDIACGIAAISVPDAPLPEGRLSIAPNPASGTIRIDANDLQGGAATISIRDITGRTMIQTSAEYIGHHISQSVEISALPPGMYFVCLDSRTAHSVVKFTKQ